ncbi:polyamine ABC transporter substrate-binding protein [Ruegeria marina]|uniref:Putrescine-binding periplasmic protein n=1 Tax=Ruegeria marina TaxID=639004 RepID=A0A1G6VVX6_9RHOB|nr:spermidine/putrescine ABC transporter substrate-binding protein [Ruegeria marina]SDD57137.1 spermidine/putrescine transport system substrate-binding protein [Ruegeria marina]
MLFTKIVATSLTAIGLLAGAAQAEELRLYNWGDYINPEILAKFTEETGIEVGLDTYSSNEEMLAKIQAGATGYDIVFPSIHMVDIMLNLNLLAKTDINQAADWGNIDTDFLRAANDPNGDYCMPYGWGTVGIFYNREKSGGDITSWEEFFAIPGKTGNKITLLDDMREVLGIGLMATGASVNSTDPAEIKAATDWLIERKGDVSAFTYAFPGLFLSGDVAAGQFFVGLAGAITEDDNLQYVIPSEGATMYEEAMCVLESAPNKEAARKFMEFMLRPEISVMNTNQQFNGSVNVPARAMLADAIMMDPNINVPAATMTRLQMFEDLGKALKAYDRAWNTIRTAE